MSDERSLGATSAVGRACRRAAFVSISSGLVALFLGACQSEIIVIGGPGDSGGAAGDTSTGKVTAVGQAQSVGVTNGTVSSAFAVSTGDACATDFVPSSVTQAAMASTGTTGGGTCVRYSTDGNDTSFISACDDEGCDCKIADPETTVCHCLLDPPGSCVGVTCCPLPWAATR